MAKRHLFVNNNDISLKLIVCYIILLKLRIIYVSACFGFQQPTNYAPPSTYSSYGYYPGNKNAARNIPYMSASATKSRIASNNHMYAEKNYDSDNPFGIEKNNIASCKHRFNNYQLKCAYSFERRVPVTTENECEQFCVTNLLSLCKSYQFDNSGKICELYDIVPSLVDDEDIDMTSYHKAADDPLPIKNNNNAKNQLRLKRFTQQNGLNLLPQSLNEMSKNFENLLKLPGITPSKKDDNCVSSIEPNEGKVYVIVDIECYKSANKNSFQIPSTSFLSQNKIESNELAPLLPMPNLITLSTVSPNIISNLKPNNLPNIVKQKNNFEREFIPQQINGFEKKIKSKVEMTDCVNGSKEKIQFIDGISLIEQRQFAVLKTESAAACLQICKMNAHLDGTRFEKICRSTTYDHKTNLCEVFGDAISPNGNLNYVPKPTSIYFEKFCIPENELVSGCDEIITRVPQHTLDNRASGTGAIITTQSQTDCIRRCITAKKNLNFICASASFYFDWTTDNCYLSRFTRINRPDIFIAERKQLVDYIEMASCMKQDVQHDEETNNKQARRNSPQYKSVNNNQWTEWSECDMNTLEKTRQRHSEEESIRCNLDNINSEEIGSSYSKMPSSFIQETTNNKKQLLIKQNKNNEKSMLKTLIQSVESDFSKTDNKNCNARKKCCRRESEVKSLVRGCSIGFRIIDDGSTVQCIPDDCE